MDSAMKFCMKCGRPLRPLMVDGEKRLGCSDPGCDFVYWGNPVPVVGGIVEYGDSVLLIQNKGWPSGWWGLVTGFLEAGETPEEGIVRELDEELGLMGKVQSLVGVYSFHRANQVIITYHLIAEGCIKVGDELVGYRAVKIPKLKAWDSATGWALRDWLIQRRGADVPVEYVEHRR